MMLNECPLCPPIEEITLRHFEDPDGQFFIMDCKTCGVPMAVLAHHAKRAYPRTHFEMERALEVVADGRLGPGRYYIDTEMRSIPGHLHWHARPIPVAGEVIVPDKHTRIDPVLGGL